jgi:hypothetical protein
MSHYRFAKIEFSSCVRSCALLAALLFAIIAGPRAFADNAAGAPPSDACFDIARPPTSTAAGTILLNRCTGETWILLRNRTRNGEAFIYRWRPIARGAAEVAANSHPRVAPRVRLPANPNSDKCFIFQGRRFCE